MEVPLSRSEYIGNKLWTGSPRPLNCLPLETRKFPRSVLDCVEILIENGLMNFGISDSFRDANSPVIRLLLSYNTYYFNYPRDLRKCANLLSRIKQLDKVLLSLGLGRGPAEYETDPALKVERQCLNLCLNPPIF